MNSNLSDEERCRLIAELEGAALPLPINADPDYALDMAIVHGQFPDYAHDLNATMRAAGRLPERLTLVCFATGRARIIQDVEDIKIYISKRVDGDYARAAFLELSDWLATRKDR